MTDDPPSESSALAPDPGEVAGRLGARVALAAFLALCCFFIVASTWQLARGVFLDGGAQGAPPVIDAHGACADHLRRLAATVETALTAASTAATDEEAIAAFRRVLAPVWATAPAAADTCAAEPEGTNTYAAVVRYRTAAEAFARHRATDLASVRHEVTRQLGP